MHFWRGWMIIVMMMMMMVMPVRFFHLETGNRPDDRDVFIFFLVLYHAKKKLRFFYFKLKNKFLFIGESDDEIF